MLSGVRRHAGRAGAPGPGALARGEAAGWILFDGKTLDGWKTKRRQAEQGAGGRAINPARLRRLHDDPREDLGRLRAALDFAITARGATAACSSAPPSRHARGRTWASTGIEIAIDDTASAGYHDTSAIYDLVRPRATR
ncbi:MAG: hypothetical protein U0790_16060 [Isosphaeraceae bacterium]